MSFNDDNNNGVKTSVVDQYAAPEKDDFLHSDIPETKEEAKTGLEEATIAAAEQTTGVTENQWQAWNSAESETNAAVEAGDTIPHPAKTAGEEMEDDRETVDNGVKTSVVDQYGAPNKNDFLHSDIPETKAQAKSGLEEATIAAAEQTTGVTENQWEAWNSAESETNAAVAAGATKPHPAETAGQEELDQSAAENYVVENVATSVINQYAPPGEGDVLASDIPETRKEEVEGLTEASCAVTHELEGETLNQWQAEGNVESETEAAVADGADK